MDNNIIDDDILNDLNDLESDEEEDFDNNNIQNNDQIEQELDENANIYKDRNAEEI